MGSASNDTSVSGLLKILWGKYSSEKNAHHPAVYHMMDVALAAEALFNTLTSCEQQQLIKPFEQSKDPLKALIFFIALHDLGKLTPGFQHKLDKKGWGKLLRENGYTCNGPLQDVDKIHGRTGFVLLTDAFVSNLPISKKSAMALANAVAGHHGSFAHGLQKKHVTVGDGLWQDARVGAIEWLFAQLQLNWADIHVVESQLTPFYIAYLAGFCSVSDWLGSDERTFDYIPDQDYPIDCRKKHAKEQVENLGIKQPNLKRGKSNFSDLFEFSANTTQKAVLELFQQTKSPVLTIIETLMGSGKTEAALMLVDKYIREQGMSGFYFALPTQATGNQLFERAVNFLSDHPAKTANVEMHLRHANASLNAKYEALQMSSVDHSQTESVVASSWFTSNKRGLLSPYAVGTVDQCLLASLQVRHFFVRLFGLSNKVVVIDEVHAYDTYTSKILEALLSWLGALETPVILLSATLPSSRRQRLLEAYNSYDQLERLGDKQTYPRITCLGKSGQFSEVNAGDSQSSLPNKFLIKLVETALTKRWAVTRRILSDKLSEGGCAVCIVNTVNDAQALFRLLQKEYQPCEGIELILFHARFPIYQRLKIENKLNDLFGKGGEESQPNPKRPKKAIVVGTQVLEQSLNVDFDLMISSLAPIDLLLQRLGRLHRHAKNNSNRPNQLSEPKFYCLHPSVDRATEDAQVIFGCSETYVYEPSCLFYTVLSLQSRIEEPQQDSTVALSMPSDVEALIDEVYEGQLNISDEEQRIKVENWEYVEKDDQRKSENVAKNIVLPDPNSNLRDFFRCLEKSENDNHIVLTRLAPPSVTLILMKENENGEWCLVVDNRPVNLDIKPDKKTQDRLIRSSVKISQANWVEYFSQNTTVPDSWRDVAVLRDCYPLQLIDNHFRCSGVEGFLRLSDDLGLEICRL